MSHWDNQTFLYHSLWISHYLTLTSLLEFVALHLLHFSFDAGRRRRSSNFFLEQLTSHTSELSSKFDKASPTSRTHYLSQSSSKLRVNSNFLIMETKGIISSTLKFWNISKAFQKPSRLRNRWKPPSFWMTLLNWSRTATERSKLLILPKVVG